MKNIIGFWDIEITDTFGGEANYSWVWRGEVQASTVRGALRVWNKENLSQGCWQLDHNFEDGARYNYKHGARCMFITWSPDNED
jgi:hypothetical protein